MKETDKWSPNESLRVLILSKNHLRDTMYTFHLEFWGVPSYLFSFFFSLFRFIHVICIVITLWLSHTFSNFFFNDRYEHPLRVWGNLTCLR